METMDRVALMRKTLPDLRHIIRRLGGDSPATEGKESLVSRILLFQPQSWKPDVKVKREAVSSVTEQELQAALKPYLLRGLKLKIRDGNWFVNIGKREDSGTLAMPITAIEHVVKYLMPKDR